MADLSISNLFNVKGKTVLVTGGGVGVGKMIATGFAQNGANVYIAARKEKQLQEAVQDIKKVARGSVDYIVANVASKAGCDALIAEFKKRADTLHVLVNNSGITWGGPFENFPEEKGWDNVYAVNVKSIFYMTAGCVLALLTSHCKRSQCLVSRLSDYLTKAGTPTDPARVINVSSIASVDPFSEGALSDAGNGTWSYQSSKAAVNHLTSQLAVKLAPGCVTVNAILPGVYPSKMTAFGLQKAGDKMNAAQPMGRVGAPSDMAGLTLFLASPASAHITGAHIITDGGARLYKTTAFPFFVPLCAPCLIMSYRDDLDDRPAVKRRRADSAAAASPAKHSDLAEKTPQHLRRLLATNIQLRNQFNVQLDNHETACDVVLVQLLKFECVERLRAILLALNMDCDRLDDNWDMDQELERNEETPDEELWSPPLSPSMEDEQTRDLLHAQYAEILNSTFNIKELHIEQAVAIDLALKNKDVLVLQPAGSGKSLIFQLPAMIEHNVHPHKVTIVISPILALIRDQLRACREKGIPVLAITSDSEENITSANIHQRLRDERPVLIYTTPEQCRPTRWLHPILLGLYKDEYISRFALDEVHCMLSWGLTFRPAVSLDDSISWAAFELTHIPPQYLDINFLRRDFPAVPIVGLSATLSPRDVVEITRHLGLNNPILVRASLARPNLHIAIEHKHSSQTSNTVVDIINNRHRHHSGIIYRETRKSCERLATKLGERGILAAAYHAGLTENTLARVYNDWMSNKIRVIVATISFGLGIDKPDVRFVFHVDSPKSISSYFQEIGRAGRDGKKAECIWFYRYKDLVRELHPSGPNAMSLLKLREQKDAQAISSVAQEPVCVVRQVLRNLGEQSSPCGVCSNCKNLASGPLKTVDMTAFAKDVLDYLRAIFTDTPGGRITPAHLAKLLSGSVDKSTRKNNWDSYPGYGSAKRRGMSQDVVEIALDKLIFRHVLAVRCSDDTMAGGGYGFSNHWYLKLGAKAHDFKYLDDDGSLLESRSRATWRPRPTPKKKTLKRKTLTSRRQPRAYLSDDETASGDCEFELNDDDHNTALSQTSLPGPTRCPGRSYISDIPMDLEVNPLSVQFPCQPQLWQDGDDSDSDGCIVTYGSDI
ncbi:hypothetical protein MIND_00011200 [Mycena indigotica]|uniref:DNA 3'-5' helicase n=1 Tax=Mycena indigotica TaxID=2126181 RepID=A0A8H6WFP7_9AGAR|nr:uncharacterized protein MIND_00011200 [Mycena indigotica]KAF7314971.1 hypothetical protein MIND_00011200 [Mycena indigotica]